MFSPNCVLPNFLGHLDDCGVTFGPMRSFAGLCENSAVIDPAASFAWLFDLFHALVIDQLSDAARRTSGNAKLDTEA
jgi:hypothetical protein